MLYKSRPFFLIPLVALTWSCATADAVDEAFMMDRDVQHVGLYSAKNRNLHTDTDLCRCQASFENFYGPGWESNDEEVDDADGYFIVDGIRVLPCRSNSNARSLFTSKNDSFDGQRGLMQETTSLAEDPKERKASRYHVHNGQRHVRANSRPDDHHHEYYHDHHQDYDENDDHAPSFNERGQVGNPTELLHFIFVCQKYVLLIFSYSISMG